MEKRLSIKNIQKIIDYSLYHNTHNFIITDVQVGPKSYLFECMIGTKKYLVELDRIPEYDDETAKWYYKFGNSVFGSAEYLSNIKNTLYCINSALKKTL